MAHHLRPLQMNEARATTVTMLVAFPAIPLRSVPSCGQLSFLSLPRNGRWKQSELRLKRENLIVSIIDYERCCAIANTVKIVLHLVGGLEVFFVEAMKVLKKFFSP